MNQIIESEPSAAIDALMDPATFAHMGSVANMLVSSCMLPDHFRGQLKAGKLVKSYDRDRQIAMAVVMLAAAKRFDVDVFQFAQSSFIIHGKLDFDGKVYIALANARAGLSDRLAFSYVGSGDQMRCVCSSRGSGERDVREVQTPPFIECSMDGSKKRPAWVGCDPEQQLSYHAARTWVRRHCPEVLLGMAIDQDQVDEPSCEPATTIESAKVDTSPLLENRPNMAVHSTRLKDADSLPDIYAAGDQIKLDQTLTAYEKRELRHEFLEQKKRLMLADEPPPWSAMLADCEEVMMESDDPSAIEKAWNAVESIDDLPPAETKRLGALFNERMKEFAQS